jgi:uncharacterized protein
VLIRNSNNDQHKGHSVTTIERALQETLEQDAKAFRIVTILGPRQAGKTTLARMTFKDRRYVSLEEPEKRELATCDPKTFLRRFHPPVIIDEVQRVPDLLSYIQVEVDERPDDKGQFILTGSHQPLLRETIAQSLAGRTSILALYPLSFREILRHGRPFQADTASHWIYRGFMPEIYRADLNPTRFYQAYAQTYVERDVRQLIQVKEQLVFERFLKLLAGRIGQLLNLDSLASDVGVSAGTIRNWISVLEASFIVFRLPPYFRNLGKRLVKTPKIYFTEIGLAAYLLGIESPEQVDRDPLYGNLFENMVMMELVKFRLSQGKNPELYFYRDSHSTEIDVVAEVSRSPVPIEIKSSATFQKHLIKSLEFYHTSIDQACKQSFLIYSGSDGLLTERTQGVHFTRAAEVLKQG